MASQLDSSLHRPQDPRWASEPGYRAEVTQRILQAYAWLKSPTADDSVDPYFNAYTKALSCLELPMSVRQRLQVCYAAGAACIGGEAYGSGLQHLDEAFGLAEDLEEWAAWAEIAFLHASADSELFHYRTAAGYLSDGLGLLDRFNDDRDPQVVGLAVDMRVTLAVCQYVVEDYASAESNLDTADAAAMQLSDAPPYLSSSAWMRAIIARWRGDPLRALALAQQAAPIFSTATSPAGRRSWVRLQTILADIALDLAETLPAPPQQVPNAFLRLAGQYANQAVRQARTEQDAIGEGMALLAQARYYRHTRRAVDNVATIERVIRTADRLADTALLAQAYTTLGFQLLMPSASHVDMLDIGLNCFRKVLDEVRTRDVPAMAIWARRALLAAALS